MSYLSPLRLHFAGKFQAAPSTVNNDPTHFDNKTFKPSYQQPQSGNQMNGWWNPAGDSVFRFTSCAITTAWRDGAPVTNDPVLSLRIADTDRKAPGKMVDLDPDQQMVSQLWGLQLRLCTADGSNVLTSDYRVTGFTDIWARDSNETNPDVGDGVYSAVYQSVLTNLDWAADFSSPFLEALRAAADEGELSIKFNVDGYDMLSMTSPWFTYGRIAGTIGAQRAGNPKQFTLGRHLMATFDNNGNPEGEIYFCTAVVDHKHAKVLLDLGNSLPTNGCGGPQMDIGQITMAYQAGSTWSSLGVIDYLQPGWYENTAGVVTLPPDRPLSSSELDAIAAAPLALFRVSPSDIENAKPAISEPADGLYVRADNFVYRLNPGDSAEVALWMTKFGEPAANAEITLAMDNSAFGPTPPPVGVPADAVAFPSSVTTNAHGYASFSISSSDPGNPRGYIDGQVYGIRPLPAGISQDYPVNPADFVSLLVWNHFEPDHPVTWYGSLQPIFQQYANLYPIMKRFLDLSSYESICGNIPLLRLAFGLDPSDPNYMPVTRDLSAAKRAAILEWLATLDSDGKPALGTPPSKEELASPAHDKAIAPVKSRGGKGAFIERRGPLPWYGRRTANSVSGEAK